MDKIFEKLTGWIDPLLQNAVWSAMINHFQWVDWMALIFLIVGIIYGIKQGLVRVLVEVFQTLVILVLVMENYFQLSDYIKKHVTVIPWNNADIFAFFILMAALWFLMAILDRLIRPWIHAKTILPLRVIGGAILGGAHFILLASFISQGLMLVSSWPVKKVYEAGNSYTGIYLAEIAPAIESYIFRPGTNPKQSKGDKKK